MNIFFAWISTGLFKCFCNIRRFYGHLTRYCLTKMNFSASLTISVPPELIRILIALAVSDIMVTVSGGPHKN